MPRAIRSVAPIILAVGAAGCVPSQPAAEPPTKKLTPEEFKKLDPGQQQDPYYQDQLGKK